KRLPTLRVLRVARKMGLGPADQLLNGGTSRIAFHPLRQRHGRHTWRTKITVEPPADQRHGKNTGRSDKPARTAWLMAIIYGLTASGQLDDATSDFRARFCSIFLGNEAAFDLDFQFRKLIAINSEVMLGVGRRFLLAQEWVHHRDRSDGCQKSGYDPEYHAHSNSDFTYPCQLRQLRRFGQSTGHAVDQFRSVQLPSSLRHAVPRTDRAGPSLLTIWEYGRQSCEPTR